jgi:hypothetical protein
VSTWITISLYHLHSPVLASASSIFRLTFTSVALPPGKQCMIAGWLFLSLILQVIESPMTWDFQFVRANGGRLRCLRPRNGWRDQRRLGLWLQLVAQWGKPVESFCRVNERHRLSIPTAFASIHHEKIVRLQGPCEGLHTSICSYWWHRRGFIPSYT